MIRFLKTSLLLLYFITATNVYSADYSFCVKESSFQRILLLSVFVDSLQYLQDNATTVKDDGKNLSEKPLKYFRVFKVSKLPEVNVVGYVIIIEDPGMGSVVIPVKNMDYSKEEDPEDINNFVLFAVKGVMSYVKGDKVSTVSAMISIDFAKLFESDKHLEHVDSKSGTVNKEGYILRTVSFDLDDTVNPYTFTEIDELSFESESLIDSLVFSDKYDLEVKLLQLKSISFDHTKLINILKRRYNGDKIEAHSLNGKFQPSLLDFVQASTDSVAYNKLVFYSYLREKQFSLSHIYSLLDNQFLKKNTSKFFTEGVVIFDSILSYLNYEELEEIKSIVLKEGFIKKLAFSDISIDVKTDIFTRLLGGSEKELSTLLYKIIEAYSNLSLDYVLADKELNMVLSLMSKVSVSSNLDMTFWRKLKMMVFDSKRSKTLGVIFARSIFEIQKMKKCTLVFSSDFD